MSPFLLISPFPLSDVALHFLSSISPSLLSVSFLFLLNESPLLSPGPQLLPSLASLPLHPVFPVSLSKGLPSWPLHPHPRAPLSLFASLSSPWCSEVPSSEQEAGVYPGILTGFVAGGETAQSRAAKPEAPGWEDFCDTHFLSFLSVLDSGHRLEESGLPQAPGGGNEEQAQRQGARCSETHSM